MVSEATKDTRARSLVYFHQEKGDMRRYCFFDQAIELFPDVKRALEAKEYADRVLDAMVEKMEDSIGY